MMPSEQQRGRTTLARAMCRALRRFTGMSPILCAFVLTIALMAPAILAGTFDSNEPWTSNPYFGDRGVVFADVDGDAKADAIVVNNDAITVRRSTGTAFGPNELWTSNPYFGDRGIFFADVDGDQKADAIVVNNNAVTV